MKIGYFVQGSMDEAFVQGLVKRWCPQAQLEKGKFRGASRESLLRELKKALFDLHDIKGCDLLVVLTDSDNASWREVKKREDAKIPACCKHVCVFGVAERNIECWMATDQGQLATFLACGVSEIPAGDPSRFVKSQLGIGERDELREQARNRVIDFVATVDMKPWLDGSDSFEDFYNDARSLAAQMACTIPNERQRD